ncbi:uncharacterized protein LOC109835935 [Asparagus officinalis]|uniref:uncharacterized protein LOC109835935 n=1 Tax=Asparagus officinalis TaxID=4686 RepID=UPI00098DFA1A|nr:uncharacterized protein LOC109835935 [Asparagus officinalis]
MELHSPRAAKRLWNLLRIAFFMMRKGLISKRKLLMDMNLMMKRGKLMSKNLGKNLHFHHHHHRTSSPFILQEYEFSCTNSPNPAFSHSKRRYFPCFNPIVEDETPRAACTVPRIEYSPLPSPLCFALSHDRSPFRSPFSVRISNFSAEEESGCGDAQVDDEAEEFIKRFYEQLRAQSRIALIEYQEKEVQEMLARGR